MGAFLCYTLYNVNKWPPFCSAVYNSVRLIAPKNEHQINTMNYEKKKAADRLQAYYLKKTEYYADLPVTERARPDQFARVWRNFKSHIKEAYTPKP